MTVLRDILVPTSLLQAPETFGGKAEGDCLRGDLVIHAGKPVALERSSPTNGPRVLLSALTEAHCHLDKCHTLHRLEAVGGDLRAAISAQIHDKENWTTDDLEHRMDKGLSELVAAGCGAVRSHIDWGAHPAPPTGWSVLGGLADNRPELTVQRAALIGIDKVSDKIFCEAAARHIAQDTGGVLGTFILDHDPQVIRDGLSNIFAVADRFGLMLDFHVDEGLGTHNGLEAICDAALQTGFQGPVLCGHAVSLMNRAASDFARIADKLARAGISVCALPTTNLYLQGRTSGTPDRRGITRLRELRDAGVRIVIASDNVADAFCPLGQHNPLAALHLATLSAHLDPPMGKWLTSVTTDAAAAIGLEPDYIDRTNIDQLRLCAGSGIADLIAGRAPITQVQTNTSQARMETDMTCPERQENGNAP